MAQKKWRSSYNSYIHECSIGDVIRLSEKKIFFNFILPFIFFSPVFYDSKINKRFKA